ncbi:ABC transporter permease [Rhizohabitans arisaemae]|uniref:ABC transporter permease n=1 Tax=Rhizohabitans arisaemae TaxID=2720610 RepID=UPI0024B0A2DB|nr:ABC transporter permease [Rhizohabitans arisaemae]
MTSLSSLSRAMLLGFLRDKTALFFTVLFPLMFLMIFGVIFQGSSAPKTEILQVGAVEILDSLPAEAKGIIQVTKSTDLNKGLEDVRKGDVDALIRQENNQIVLHYSQADQVRAGTVRSIVDSFVQRANLAGQPGRFQLRPEQVEDKSLKAIQFFTPGILGWAIATGATFGAAMTLVSWRQKKILRRLRLSPVRTTTIVSARVGVSIGVALLQTALFLGVATLPFFGLQLASSWWASIFLIIAGTLAFLAVGLVAGAVSKTPEGASGIANLLVLPMAFLGGTFFPLDDAPGWMQAVANFLPLSHLTEGMQDVMVRGLGVTSILPELGILLGFSVVVSLLAVKLFTWDDV